MSKYIDAERLTVFVQARRDRHYNHFVKNGVGCIAEYKYDEDVELLDLITSLQQEQTEVDLEKDIEKICDFNKAQTTVTLTKGGLRAAAYHFYELGLKAGKEE